MIVVCWHVRLVASVQVAVLVTVSVAGDLLISGLMASVATVRLVRNGSSVGVGSGLLIGNLVAVTVATGAMVTTQKAVRVSAGAEAAAGARDNSNLVASRSVYTRAEAVLLVVSTDRLPDILASVGGIGIDGVGVDRQTVAIAGVVDLGVGGGVSVTVSNAISVGWLMVNLMVDLMMVVLGGLVNVSGVGLGISVRWGHILNLSLLLDDLELDRGLHNLNVMHGLVAVMRSDVVLIYMLDLLDWLMDMLDLLDWLMDMLDLLDWLGLLLVAVSLLLSGSLTVVVVGLRFIAVSLFFFGSGCWCMFHWGRSMVHWGRSRDMMLRLGAKVVVVLVGLRATINLTCA